MTNTRIVEIEPGNLIQEVLQIKHDGYHLVQICATKIENGVELLYSFGKEYELLCLRFRIEEGTEVLSISDIFSPAFLYENEIHDLYGVPIKLISIDFQGNLYRTEIKTPFK